AAGPARRAPSLARISAGPLRLPGHSAEDCRACLGLDHRRLRPSGSWTPAPSCRPAPGALHGPGGLIPTLPMGLAGHADWQRRHTPAATCVGVEMASEGQAVDRWRFEVKRLVLVFNKEKETKGTYRYREVEVAERDTAVGS